MFAAVKPFVRHLRGKQLLLLTVFALGLLSSAASLATPLLGKTFIDAVSGQADYSVVPYVAGALLGLALADLLLGTLNQLVHTKLSARVLIELRVRIFNHCLNAPIERLEKFRHGDLLSRFSTDLPQIQTLLVDGTVGFIQNLLFLCVATLILLHLSPLLALWSLMGIFIALIVSAAFRRPIENGTRVIREIMASLSHFLAERLGALRAVRLHQTQDDEEQDFVQQNNQLVHKLLRFQVLDALASGLPGILLTASLAWIYLLGGGLLETGEISLGTFVAFILYQGRLYAPARGLLGFVKNLQAVRVSLERVNEVLETTQEVPGRQPPVEGEHGILVCQNLHFAYPAQPQVLTNIQLRLVAGQRIALFGPSGAGKSTFVQLLFGVRQPQSGLVSLGGMRLGYAGSEPFLLHATVIENLRYGNPKARFAQITAAAKIAHAHEFIQDLPEGYQTIIGGKGQRLSDGQRQRLGIARLVLNCPDVGVFDEAFSALDAETEAQVRRNLWQHFSSRILVVITHSLANLNEFSQLYLLHNGQLREVEETELLRVLDQNKPTAIPLTRRDSTRNLLPALGDQLPLTQRNSA